MNRSRVTVLGLVGGAPGGETPRVADSSAAGAGRGTGAGEETPGGNRSTPATGEENYRRCIDNLYAVERIAPPLHQRCDQSRVPRGPRHEELPINAEPSLSRAQSDVC